MSFKIAFCSDHTNPFYDAVLRGVREVLDPEDADLVSWEGRLAFPVAALQYLKPDGVIVGPAEPESLDPELPRVGFSNAKKDGVRPAVVNDDREAGRMAVQAAGRAGYGHIGLLTQETLQHARLRAAGVREEADRLGLGISELDMILRPLEPDETFQDVWMDQQNAFHGFLESLPGNGAVVALGHGNAREAYTYLKQDLGRQVPEEAGVLLVDLPDEPGSPLAYVRLDGEEVGRRAAGRLLRRLRGEADGGPEVEEIAPTGLVRGDSLRGGEIQKVFERLRAWCGNRLREDLSVEDMCREAGMSRRSLEMKLKQDGFPSPYELLTDLRVAEAKRLLRETGLRMEEIAERCGFSDGRALRKRFQARTGMTPRTWRREDGRGREDGWTKPCGTG